MITIYALADSSASPARIRYVGRAGEPMTRLQQHWKDRIKGEKPLHEWLRTLSALPLIIALAEVEPEHAVASENFFISSFKLVGMALLNGDGGPGAWGSLGGKKPKEADEKKVSVALTQDIYPLDGSRRHDADARLVDMFIGEGVEAGELAELRSISSETVLTYPLYVSWLEFAHQGEVPMTESEYSGYVASRRVLVHPSVPWETGYADDGKEARGGLALMSRVRRS